MKTREEIRETTKGKIPRPDNYQYGVKLPEWELAETTLSRDQFICQVEPMHDRIVVQLLTDPQFSHEPIPDLECCKGHIVGGQCARCKYCREWIRPVNLQDECPKRPKILLTDAKPLIGGCRKAKVLKTGPGRWIPGEWYSMKVHNPLLPVGEIRAWAWEAGYRRPVSVQSGQIVLIGNWVDLELEDIALCAEGDVRSIWQN